MNTLIKHKNRLKMDLLMMMSPQALLSLAAICTLQTLNLITKPWNRGLGLGDVVHELYGGIMWYEFISPQAAAFWLLQLLPCGMAFAGFLEGSMDRRLIYTAYRFRSQTAWWLSKVAANLLGCFAIALMSGLLCALIGFLGGHRGLRVASQDAQGFFVLSLGPVLLALLAYALQMGILTGLGMLAYLLTRSSKVALLSYILPAAWSIMRYSEDDPVLMDNRRAAINWGMAKRFAQGGGFGVDPKEAILFSLLAILALALLGALVQQVINQTQRQAR